ncbi:hypothetical protein HMPREF0973_00741 [Prevotella veroralis F0319]|uniref:Uncharacterized protein n=1 Tax=Prevotella veroralis F0319 TaxID=649761 RepID=C9MMB1_9BACT|nr:hypothetical protein HMPREF0973_00741 [Prevotella veroralis F0319]
MRRNRDRRPRPETPPILSRGEECLMEANLDRFLSIQVAPKSRDRRPRLSA